MAENDGARQTMTEEPVVAKSGLGPRYRTAVAITFFITLLVSLGAIWQHTNIIRRDSKDEALALSGYQASMLSHHLDGALSATYALAVVLRENGYRVNHPVFERLATDLLRFHPGAASLQYAPDGVVQHIVPLAGNEGAIGHDLLADPKRNRKALEAIESRQLTLDGPFKLVQGGVGLVGRLPVFRVDRTVDDDFWGFASVLISLTDLLKAAEVGRLEKQGYDYILWRLHPDTGKPQIIARSGPERLRDAITYDFVVYNGTWHLSAQPREGWLARNNGVIWLEVGVAFCLALLVARLAHLLLKQPILLQQMVELRTRELRESEEALRRHQEHLEELVQERTASLLEKDEQLEENNLELETINIELETTVVQLETANRELESFTYAVSHDLRAPLRHVGSFASILAEDCKDHLDSDGRAYLDRIVKGCNRMQEMIDSLLALSKIDQCELVSRTVDLSDMARGIAKELQEGEPGRLVEFIVAEGVSAQGDPSLLRMCLDNLLNNAWKYSGRCEAARIEFGSSAVNGETVYYVRDNGAGFDMAHADRLFVPFQRLHREEDFGGTGVGLATVQRIVHRHGGRIWFHAVPGQGATFSFTLAGWRNTGHEKGRPATH